MRRTILLPFTALAVGTLFFFAEALFSPVADAVPAFARKTGLSCSACQQVSPRLRGTRQIY
jgi:xanthine/uracil/vitamin C permease (AzgA family)